MPRKRKSSLMNMTEGRPLRLLFVFAVPLLIGNLFQQAYNLVDSMIVGRLLGANAPGIKNLAFASIMFLLSKGFITFFVYPKKQLPHVTVFYFCLS